MSCPNDISMLQLSAEDLYQCQCPLSHSAFPVKLCLLGCPRLKYGLHTYVNHIPQRHKEDGQNFGSTITHLMWESCLHVRVDDPADLALFPQLEVFHELNAAAINASLKADSSPSPSAVGAGFEARDGTAAQPPPDVWKSPEDRQFLLALLLHCADISNAVKPFTIAEK